MLLYKYTSYDIAVKILENKKIRYSQPIAFNDPFEVFPVANQEISEDKIKNLFTTVLTKSDLNFAYHNAMRAVYDTLKESQKKYIPPESFDLFMRTKIKDEMTKKGIDLNDIIHNKINEDKDGFTKKIFENLQLTIGGYLGIFSLSSVPDNILMWSHYSESHNGVVIIFDVNNDYFKNMKKVHYTDNRPPIDINVESYSLEDSVKIAHQIFYSKSNLWSYENEYRDLKLLNEGTNTTYSDKNGFLIILFKIPDEIIKGIIFGCKVVKERRNLLMQKAKNLGYELTFSSTIINDNKFALDIEDIK